MSRAHTASLPSVGIPLLIMEKGGKEHKRTRRDSEFLESRLVATINY